MAEEDPSGDLEEQAPHPDIAILEKYMPTYMAHAILAHPESVHNSSPTITLKKEKFNADRNVLGKYMPPHMVEMFVTHQAETSRRRIIAQVHGMGS